MHHLVDCRNIRELCENIQLMLLRIFHLTLTPATDRRSVFSVSGMCIIAWDVYYFELIW